MTDQVVNLKQSGQISESIQPPRLQPGKRDDSALPISHYTSSIGFHEIMSIEPRVMQCSRMNFMRFCAQWTDSSIHKSFTSENDN